MSYILAATGLQREAKIIARPGLVAVSCGGHGALLEAALEAQIARERPRGVMSVGIAGALDPGLRVGDVVTGTRLERDGRTFNNIVIPANAGTHLRNVPEMGSRVRGDDGSLKSRPSSESEVLGVDLAVTTDTAKAALRAATNAAAVDMESHIAARVAARHKLPFAAIRVISDTAHHDLPPAACVPLRPDGSIDLPRVLVALARQPSQLPALLRLARDTNVALKVLADLLRRLDSLTLDRLLGLDLGELGLDVLREDELGGTRVG